MRRYACNATVPLVFLLWGSVPLFFFLGGGGLRDNLDSMPGRAGAATRKVLQPDGTQFCKCFAVLFCAQFCKFRVIRCMKHRTK